MKLQARNFVVRKPETIDITMFFKKFCIATRTKPNSLKALSFQGLFPAQKHRLTTILTTIHRKGRLEERSHARRAAQNQSLQLIRRIGLHVAGGMSVNVQHKADGAVAQHARKGLYVHSRPDAFDCERMSQIMKTMVLNPSAFEHARKAVFYGRVWNFLTNLIGKHQIERIAPGRARA